MRLHDSVVFSSLLKHNCDPGELEDCLDNCEFRKSHFKHFFFFLVFIQNVINVGQLWNTSQPLLIFRYVLFASWASLVAWWWRICLPKQESHVQSLGWEDPLEKGMAAHSSLAWRIPWTEEPDGLQSMGVTKESDTTEWLTQQHLQDHFYQSLFLCISLATSISAFISTIFINMCIYRYTCKEWNMK